eukprot:TRINITY_DN6153_c0_g1_i4.p1 TRINITY_DN6153_c0_g1~~TRINITY_DN6153_c0_g1_i4.p1  ORF type:complete len:398 (-),score=86.80 TRINITY_DN6153_c0_g1_i4:288-1481(-)
MLGDRTADVTVAAGFCTVAAVCSGLHIWGHLSHFAEPRQQKHIVRILLMVPIYAILSCCSLSFPEHDIVFDSIRDCYEAFTIYSFFQLLLSYIGGESNVGAHFREKLEVAHPWPCGSCLPMCKLDASFLRRMKQGVLQFVFVKPTIAAITLILDSFGAYGKDEWVPTEGFLWIQIVYNISYTWALYALALFYGATAELLVKYKPVKKFVMVKLIVFVSFWQGFTISLFLSFGAIGSDAAAADIQAFLICVEMAVAAMLHLIAFPINEYSTLELNNELTSRTDNMRSVVNVQDVLADAINNYSTTYRQYELQTQGDACAQPRAFVARSFVLKEDQLGAGSPESPEHSKADRGDSPRADPEEMDVNPFTAAQSCAAEEDEEACSIEMASVDSYDHDNML